jgi:DNA gyrase subunit A
VVLSQTGLLARVPLENQAEAGRARAAASTAPDLFSAADERPGGRRGKAPAAAAAAGTVTAADLVACALATTVRATVGAVTSAGRMIKFSVLEVPAITPGAGAGTPGLGGSAAGLSGGHPVEEFVPGLAHGETVLALAPLDGPEAGGVALGTASGVVKRVQPDYPANRDEFELITLKDDDRVVGAAYLTGDDAELVFITSDAQLLRFPAASVRPQGRPAAGMAGVRLDGAATVVWFGAAGPAVVAVGGPGAIDSGAVVVTVAGRSGALPGTGGASVKVTPFAEYPAKGRATGGVRCQRFLKGEDGLIQAWIGPVPVVGVTESGVIVDLTGMTGRRDGSGNAVTRQLAHLGTPLRLG